MAFTTEQLTALEEAYAQGVLTVEYSDKKVTYRTKKEMAELINEMKVSLGQKQTQIGRRYGKFYSGY